MSGIIFCGNCGLQLLQRGHFCPRCGTPSDLTRNAHPPSWNSSEQFCIVCGGPLVCPVCLSQVLTKPISPPETFTPLLWSRPTRSLHIETPPANQLYDALASKHNPYARWGTLVIDESEKAMWKQEEHLGDGVCEYQAGSFVITSPAPRLVWMHTPVSLDNFAYQVLVTGGAHPLGLVFRANRAHSSYYLLVKESIWLKLYLIEGNRGRELHQFRSDDRQWYAYDNRAYKSRPVLLGIVAQGATIDVYENLTHLGSTRDESRSTGEIGLFVAKNGMFSHTKVWQKH